MKNFVQAGNTVSVTASADTLSGAGVLVGLLFGIAAHDALSGEPLEIDTVGVFDVVKAAGTAWTDGGAVYWNGTAMTAAAGTGNLFVGVALGAQTSGAVTGTVRLNGSAPAALTS